MIEPPFPGDETFRLAALQALPLLDTGPEDDFDAVVHLARQLFSVETCLVTLVDANRQWFKARVGLDAPETPRSVSFCGHAILQDDVFVIPDATQDQRFHDNPLVTGAPFIRFYASAPIRLPSGYTIGTVCLLDPRPRDGFGTGERARLAAMAGLTLNLIALRALRDDADRARGRADRSEAAIFALPAPVAFLDAEGRLEFFNPAFAALCASPPVEGSPVAEALGIADGAWSPAAMIASGTAEVTIPHRAAPGGLVVTCDSGGFVITTAA